MISSARRSDGPQRRELAKPGPLPAEKAVMEELERLRAENRRLAISLGGFSAYIASKGLLEDAWHYVHAIHQIEDGGLV